MKRIVVLFSGQGTNLTSILEHLHRKRVIVAAAITDNPQAGGLPIARSYGIPTEIIDKQAFDTREAFDAALVSRIQTYRPDLVVLAGFMRILTAVFTRQVRAINLHPSLLPRHKGLRAIERSFHDPYDEGGVSVHWVSEVLDGGEIIVQKSIPKSGHTLTSYTQAIRRLEKEALREAILKVLDA